MASGSLVKQFYEETTCPICLEYYTDPVTTDCGHNFCRNCLTQTCGEQVRRFPCPECRQLLHQSSLRSNRKLASIVELTKKFSLQEAKRKEGAGRECKTHQEPLKLFCWDDEDPICVVCEKSKEHMGHQINPAEEAAEVYKQILESDLQILKNKREKVVEWKLSEEQRSKEYLKQLEAEKQQIMSVFKKMHKFLEEKERCWLRELAELEKEITKRKEENIIRLSQEISRFSNLIKDGEVKSQQPPSEFLQDIRNALTRWQMQQTMTPLELSLGSEWELRSNLMKSSILKKAMQEFEGSLRRALNKEDQIQIRKPEQIQGQTRLALQSRVTTGAPSVTLDPDTAHHRLILSEDLKSVRCEIPPPKLLEKPETFDVMPCVLGSEIFTSGKHCWEVEKLKEKGWWAVGVARESLERKGWIRISPNVGIWAVGNDASKLCEAWALTSPRHTRLTLKGQLKKIRVSLDYEEGSVKFFNADTEDLIFTYPSASFSEEGIRPFFWVEGGASLQC